MTTVEHLMERLSECECERRAYLLALSVIREQLVGHAVKPGHVRKMIETIDVVVGTNWK